jgi:hypothetical protein
MRRIPINTSLLFSFLNFWLISSFRKIITGTYEIQCLAPFPQTEESKAELIRQKSAQDPVALNSRLNKAVEGLLKINREKDKVKQPSGQEAGQAQAV